MLKRNFVISLQKFLFENYSVTVTFTINLECTMIFSHRPSHPPPPKKEKRLCIVFKPRDHNIMHLYHHHTFGTHFIYR